MTGFLECFFRSQETISSSAAVSPAWPSTTRTMTSASAVPAAACRSMASGMPAAVDAADAAAAAAAAASVGFRNACETDP